MGHSLKGLHTLDQRYFQIVFLTGLLLYGMFVVDIEHMSIAWVMTILVSSQVTQWFFSRAMDLPYDYRSPLISTLSISILLNSQLLLIGMLAAFMMVASKFLLRTSEKHLFNPANFGVLVAVIFFSPYAMISPGQWGPLAGWVSLVVAVVGVCVTSSIKRYDIAFFFLGGYATVIVLLSLLGVTHLSLIPTHFTSISVLLFSFFMITDPKTIPNTRLGRFIFALACAAIGGIFHFIIGLQPGFFYALPLACLATPLIDRTLGGEKFQWRQHKHLTPA